MYKQYLTHSPDWFDRSTAEVFDEGVTDNLNTSLATGTQDDHERLYKTDDGRWVLRSWTGHIKPQKWEEITREAALAWLDRNNWQPVTTTYRGQTFTRSIDETPAEYQARVNAAVLGHQRK